MRAGDDRANVSEDLRRRRLERGRKRQLAVEPERVLDEIVRADRDEVGLSGDLRRERGGLRGLDHRPHPWPGVGPGDLLERRGEQRAHCPKLCGIANEREEQPQARLGAGAQDRAQLRAQGVRVGKCQLESPLGHAGEERRRLVLAEVERAHGGDASPQQGERLLECLELLRLARPVVGLEERELGSQQTDALRSSAKARGDVHRCRGVREQCNAAAVARDGRPPA